MSPRQPVVETGMGEHPAAQPLNPDAETREREALPELDPTWDLVAQGGGCWFAFEGDVLRRVITTSPQCYAEAVADLVTLDRREILPISRTGKSRPCTPQGLPSVGKRHRFQVTPSGIETAGKRATTRRHHYREGDIVALELDDGTWGFARNLFDLYHRRRDGELAEGNWRVPILGQAILLQPWSGSIPRRNRCAGHRPPMQPTRLSKHRELTVPADRWVTCGDGQDRR